MRVDTCYCAIPANVSCLSIELRFHRCQGHFVMQTYVPTCLIVVVSWLSFWMRPEAMTERIMLGVTSLLTVMTQHYISVQSLPPVSYVKVSWQGWKGKDAAIDM